MSDDHRNDIDLRPWTADDLDLMTRLLGDPAMTDHLGGPEPPDQLVHRLNRYVHLGPETGRMFVITVGPDRVPAGSVGYWPNESGESTLETGWSVLPEFQGRGVAARGTAICLEIAAAEGYRSIHAYPAVANGPSNGVCRRLAFMLLGEADIEYPAGHWMRCNDWSFDLAPLAAAGAQYEVVGERVALGPLRPALFPIHQTWVNDPDVAWNVFGAPHARTFEEERAWLVREAANQANRFWLVYSNDEHRPIGVTSLTDIDQAAGTAAFRILIGSPRDRGRGLGREASRLVLEEGFDLLGIREIRLDVFGYNVAAIRLYETLGFREVSRSPMTTARDGVRWDAIRMASRGVDTS
jgi:RimJ/RimL family protein N-acetyltransferase